MFLHGNNPLAFLRENCQLQDDRLTHWVYIVLILNTKFVTLPYDIISALCIEVIGPLTLYPIIPKVWLMHHNQAFGALAGNKQ